LLTILQQGIQMRNGKQGLTLMLDTIFRVYI
jgi:hypothetical protein